MKCPLLAIGYLCFGDQQVSTKCECIGGQCAWWDITADGCAVLQLAFELDEVHCRLEKLVAQMPHERQFRK